MNYPCSSLYPSMRKLGRLAHGPHVLTQVLHALVAALRSWTPMPLHRHPPTHQALALSIEGCTCSVDANARSSANAPAMARFWVVWKHVQRNVFGDGQRQRLLASADCFPCDGVCECPRTSHSSPKRLHRWPFIL